MTRNQRDKAQTKIRSLTAGPISFVLDEQSGMLRYICYGNVEVLRGIYVALRDQNWDTVAPQISQLTLQQQDTGAVEVSFVAICRRGEIDFSWRGLIQADPDSGLCYTMRGRAHRSFLRNRIGFCVLHPISGCASQPCRVTRMNGQVIQATFPELISPHQPFTQMRSIRHQIVSGVDAEVSFAGEVFEMEDQRNWTDASFKTYGTPLELPFPVTVPAGTELEQSVQLTMHHQIPRGDAISIRALPRQDVHALPSPRFRSGRLPPIGLCVAPDNLALTPLQSARLIALRLSHLRVALKLDQPHWESTLAAAGHQAEQLGVELDVAITLGNHAEHQLRELAAQIRLLPIDVNHWYVFHTAEKSTSGRWIDLARRDLGSGKTSQFVIGTDAYFAELNRQHPDVSVADAVCYSINPQVHASDNLSLVETLQVQADTVHTARSFCGPLPIFVGPISLKPRFNPNATTAEDAADPNNLPPQVDARQSGLLAAGWTLGSIAQLATAGTERLTYYETIGWRGIMETEQGCPLPSHFRSHPNGVYPLYHVFADLADFAGKPFDRLDFDCPLQLGGIGLRDDRRTRWMVANFSECTQTLQLPAPESLGGTSFAVRTIDVQNVDDAMRSPEDLRSMMAPSSVDARVTLSAHAFATIDLLMKKGPA